MLLVKVPILEPYAICAPCASRAGSSVREVPAGAQRREGSYINVCESEMTL